MKTFTITYKGKSIYGKMYENGDIGLAYDGIEFKDGLISTALEKVFFYIEEVGKGFIVN